MYWLKGTSRITTPTILSYVIGEAQDFRLSLVTDTGETLTDAFLFVSDHAYAGLVKAKKASDSAYREIMGPYDTWCYLGPIAAESETPIDFRIEFPAGTTDGYRIISILVGHGDGIQQSTPHLSSNYPDLWHEDWSELWAADW